MAKNLLGFVNFDQSLSNTTEVQIMIPQKNIYGIKLGQYVRIESDFDGSVRNFFGIITKGPFYEPDAVSKDSAFARASILEAESVKFKPNYHAVCFAQIMGEIDVSQMKMHGTFIRPKPQASVHSITSDEISKFLELMGDMYIGRLDGYSDVKVQFPSNKNAALPRNLGIFGTVGSGKTNTSQVLIEEASRTNWAVIVLDIEGEYVDMDKSSEEESLQSLMTSFRIAPAGIASLDVLHPVNTEASREDSKPFSVRFSNIEPGILSEIMDLSGPQNERFLQTWHNLVQKMGTRKNKNKSTAGFVRSVMDGFEGGPGIGITLHDMMSQIDDILGSDNTRGPDKTSYFALRRKLKKLDRYDIFDNENNLINYNDMFRSNHVSVIDLSNSTNSRINNIIVMDILRKIFEMKLEDKDKSLPPILIVIEEAHTLVSKNNASKMEETLDIIREISRRGRKRWISLCFISQQPSHLPPEIYELCNTKIAHQTTGGKNLDAIKGATGGVDSNVWDNVPRLGQGTCLFISSFFKNRPMFVNVRPCMSKRRHIE